jgi:sterol 14alpha-demethylase
MLNLANKPRLIKELFQEQIKILGSPPAPLTWEYLQKLSPNNQVIKETLRLHSPIHPIMRQVKNPMPTPETDWIAPPTHVLTAPPGVPAGPEFFTRPTEWDLHHWDKIESSDNADEDAPKVDYGFGLYRRQRAVRICLLAPEAPLSGRAVCVCSAWCYYCYDGEAPRVGAG